MNLKYLFNSFKLILMLQRQTYSTTQAARI